MREIVSYCHRNSCVEWEKLWDEAEKKLRKESSRNALDPLLRKIGRVAWITRANDLFQNADFQAWLHELIWLKLTSIRSFHNFHLKTLSNNIINVQRSLSNDSKSQQFIFSSSSDRDIDHATKLPDYSLFEFEKCVMAPSSKANLIRSINGSDLEPSQHHMFMSLCGLCYMVDLI